MFRFPRLSIARATHRELDCTLVRSVALFSHRRAPPSAVVAHLERARRLRGAAHHMGWRGLSLRAGLPRSHRRNGRLDGVIAEGVITSANLLGSLAGQPLSALVTLISNGGAYVNVHTNDGVSPTNSGPGDFPGGEIRGQIEHRGHRQ